MPQRVRPRRDFSELERRRKQAGRLFAAGKMILSSVARELKVSRQSVSRWYAEWKQGGTGALKGAGRAGRKPKLEPKQLRQLEKAMRRGAQANGFQTNLWTLPRVAQVVERVTGVQYHPGHVWKVLGAMDWTPQRPAKQARQRNAEKVKLWLEERWPEVKKSSQPTGLDLLPGRKWSLATTVHSNHLGSQRGNAGLDPCLQLVEDFHLRRHRLSLGRPPQPRLLSDSRR